MVDRVSGKTLRGSLKIRPYHVDDLRTPRKPADLFFHLHQAAPYSLIPSPLLQKTAEKRLDEEKKGQLRMREY